jgi:hypothetical protein
MAQNIDTSTEAVVRLATACDFLAHQDAAPIQDKKAAATLRALAAERDALKAPRGYATCAHCGGQNGWIEADMAAEVERRCADAYAERDRLAADVAKLREALTKLTEAFPETDADNSIGNLWARYGSDLAVAVREARAALAEEPTTDAPVMCRCGSVSERACSEATPRFPECEVPDE